MADQPPVPPTNGHPPSSDAVDVAAERVLARFADGPPEGQVLAPLAILEQGQALAAGAVVALWPATTPS